MNDFTKKSLDFQHILNRIDIKTPYGQIYKKKIKPYIIGEEEKLIEELNKVQECITYIKKDKLIRDINNIFHNIKDLRSSIKRAREGGTLSEVELFEIKSFLFSIRDLYNLLNKYQISLWDDMEIEPIDSLEKLLDPESTGVATFYIYDNYSKELKEIREEKRDCEREIKVENKNLKEKIQEELNLKLNPDGTVIISKDKEEVITRLKDFPYLHYISETYMNIKYSLKPTDNMNRLKKKIQILKDKEEQEEMNIREKLTKEIGKHSKELFANIANIGRLDFLLGKAHFALQTDGVKPNIIKEHSLTIEEGRHPKIEEMLEKKDLKFTPISVDIKEGTTCITGANMGGKTVSLKLIGLLTAMAQHGLLVPAKKMTLGLNNFIKSSIGDMQSVDKGLSTFGGEIQLIQEAIEIADEKGLILIDELARGTNPEEGYLISKAIVQYLMDKNSITVLTTHYDNIGNMDNIVHLQVVGLSNIDLEKLESKLKDIDIDKMDIINSFMDYRLKKADKDKQVPKDAINIAKIMGLDSAVIDIVENQLK